MAVAHSNGSGNATIPPEAVTELVRQATGLPSTFFLSIAKARILADGSLQANYNFDSAGQPPPATQVAGADEQPVSTSILA